MTVVPPLKWRAISEIIADLLLLDYDLRAAPHRVWLECRASSHSFMGNLLFADNSLPSPPTEPYSSARG